MPAPCAYWRNTANEQFEPVEPPEPDERHARFLRQMPPGRTPYVAQFIEMYDLNLLFRN